jgi:glucokinase
MACTEEERARKPTVRRKPKSGEKHRRSAARDQAKRRGLVLGVDIGGTKVAAGLVDLRTGEIRAQVKMPMAACGRAEDGLSAVRAAIDRLLQNGAIGIRDVQGIGLCAPGPLDPRRGVVINPPNVPCWRDFPLAAEVAKAYGRSARLDNDANAAALAETIWGAGRGYRNVFYATIGTGIGTGIVLDGKILHGRTGAAGEGGHMSIDYRGPQCACGKHGCIEALAAGPAIARAARQVAQERPEEAKMLLEFAGRDPSAITSEMVGAAFEKGDRIAQQILTKTMEYLSCWLGNVIDLLEPEVIIVGGGVSLMLKPLLKELGKHLPRYCENQRAGETPLVPSHFGDAAGIAGAAALCSDVARVS